MDVTRRQAIGGMLAAAGAGAARIAAADNPQFRIATFSVDVTPPVGHPLLGGLQAPAATIGDPLFARGLILLGAGKPVVILGLDWCELRNDAYDRWRDALANAVGTSRERAMVSCLHQHDAPYADWRAQELLSEHGLPGAMFDPKFFEETVQRVDQAAADALGSPQRVTHLGIGEAKVERVACNRRVEIDGRVRFNRYSFTRDPQVREAPDGEIDPMLKTISFWDGPAPRAAVSCYAVHPMSYYGRGKVSADFVGMARSMRQRETPEVFQIYLSGCAGDVTAARYNTGDEAGRLALAERLHHGMQGAWAATKRVPLQNISFRNAPMPLPPWEKPELSIPHLTKVLADPQVSRTDRIYAAMGISWRERCAAGQPVDLPVLDSGAAQIALLPAEAFVGFQLAAQEMRPDSFVMTPAYSECAPGYFPTAAARDEGFVEEHNYCWVAPGAHKPLLEAMAKALVS
ncbi:MAG: hypothetical protein KY475_26970 [Planctomycetes bacterium]|nr:hypothetical protein [Planctomycetota bacterium]